MKCRRCNKRMGLLGISFGNDGEYCSHCKKTLDARNEKLAQEYEKLEQECYAALANRLADGLNRSTADGILSTYVSQGLPDSRITYVKRLLYMAAVTAASKDEQITRQEANDLLELKDMLSLRESDVSDIDAHRAKQENIWAIKQGAIPKISVNIPLRKGETAHFHFEPVEFHQERVVSRKYEGGSSGASIRIARGLTYRIGQHRGQLVSRTSIIHLDTGALILSSKRLIYSGPSKSFSVAREKILNIDFFADGFSFVRDSVATSNRPFYLMYFDMDYLGVALSAWLNRDELREDPLESRFRNT